MEQITTSLSGLDPFLPPDQLEATFKALDNASKKSNGCLTCGLSQSAEGFPVVYIHGKRYFARRVVFASCNGMKMSDLGSSRIKSTCGHPMCVRPEHLFLASPVTVEMDCLHTLRGKNVILTPTLKRCRLCLQIGWERTMDPDLSIRDALNIRAFVDPELVRDAYRDEYP